MTVAGEQTKVKSAQWRHVEAEQEQVCAYVIDMYADGTGRCSLQWINSPFLWNIYEVNQNEAMNHKQIVYIQ